MCTDVSRDKGSVQAHARYCTGFLVAVELNRSCNNLIHSWVAFLNMACALVAGSLYAPGLRLKYN